MDFIFLIELGEWIANIKNPYSMTAAIFLGVFAVMKFLIVNPLAEKTHIEYLKTLNRALTYAFVIAIFGLVVTVALSFIDKVDMNSHADLEKALIQSVSGEYDGVVHGMNYSVKIDSVKEQSGEQDEKLSKYDFNYEIMPSNALKPETGKGIIVAQRKNPWEEKDFTIDFSNSINLKNMRGAITVQEVGSRSLYKITFNGESDFLTKKWK